MYLICLKCRQVLRATDLLGKFQSTTGLGPHVLSVMVTGFIERGELSRARHALTQLVKLGAADSSTQYVSAAVAENAQKILPDAYHSYIHAAPQEATKLFLEMRQHKVTPHLSTYKLVLQHTKDEATIKQIHEDAERNGIDLKK